MRTFIVLLIVTFGSVSFASPCADAKKDLEKYFQEQPNHCFQESDCNGFFFRADSCEPAVVLPLKVVTKSFEVSLLKLQEVVRKSCVQEFKNHPPCEALPFKALCKNRKCVNQ